MAVSAGRQIMKERASKKISELVLLGCGLPLRQLFYESNAALLADLVAAHRAGDLQSAVDCAHAIKGAGLFAGFSALAEAAGEIEASLLDAHFDHADRAIQRTHHLLSCRADVTEGLS
jgi:HPt (histidine-containing phosphotransfer) domain-containing protein